MKTFKKIILIKDLIKYLLFLIIGYLIYKQLSGSYIELSTHLKKFNYIYFLLAIFFITISYFLSSYALFLVFRTKKKLKFSYWNLTYFNSNILEHIPFLGISYRAKKLKDDHNLKYINFLSFYSFALMINFFIILVLINLFLIKNNLNFLNIDTNLFNLFLIFFLLLLLIIYYLFKLKFIVIYLNKKNFFFNKLINFFFNFLLIQSNLLKKKLILKYIILIFFTHLFNFLCFVAIFQTFNFSINLYDKIFIYLIFSISTIIKLVPKNYVINEYIGASLIGKTAIGFAGGLLFFIIYRFLSLISALLFFLYFNSNNIVKKKRLSSLK